MGVGLQARIQGFASTASALGQIPSLLSQLAERIVTEAMTTYSQVLRTQYLEGPYPTEIQSRTGSFRRTFRRGEPHNIFRVETAGTRTTGTFGSDDIRAHILNEGGIIRPKRGQFLAVPTGFAKTAGGVVKAEFRRPLREIPNTMLIRNRSGLILWQRIGPRGRRGRLSEIARPLYFLVRQVTIIGRQFMQKTLARAEPQIQAEARNRFEQFLERAVNPLFRRTGR